MGGQNLWLFPNDVAQAKSNWTEVLTASNLLRFLSRFRVSEPRGHVSKPVGPAGRRLRIPPWTRDRGCRALNKRGPGHGGTCRGQGTLGTPGCLLPLVCTSVFVSPAGSPVPPRPPDVQACVQACERVCACSGVSTRVCVCHRNEPMQRRRACSDPQGRGLWTRPHALPQTRGCRADLLPLAEGTPPTGPQGRPHRST